MKLLTLRLKKTATENVAPVLVAVDRALVLEAEIDVLRLILPADLVHVRLVVARNFPVLVLDRVRSLKKCCYFKLRFLSLKELTDI